VLVILRFSLNGEPYELKEMGIIFSVSQGRLDINLMIGKKAAS